jgi:hypothetical protein
MADDTRALRERIEERRSDISETVEQIENRIMPGRIMARRSDRVRRTVSGWKDAVFGSDGGSVALTDPWDAYGASRRTPGPGHDESLVERAGAVATSARAAVGDSVHEAPAAVRQRTTGNPVTAGAIALGVGWIIGSSMPKTEREQAVARRVEPALTEAAHAVVEEGKAAVDDLSEPAREALSRVEQTGAEVAAELRDDAKQAARTVREQAQGQPGD